MAQDRITYLGHIIDNKGLHHVNNKVDDIHNAHQPENISDLQYFIGLLCYYNKFLLRLSTVMAPSMNYSEKIHLGIGITSNQSHSNNAKRCYIVVAISAFAKGVGCVFNTFYR